MGHFCVLVNQVTSQSPSVFILLPVRGSETRSSEREKDSRVSYWLEAPTVTRSRSTRFGARRSRRRLRSTLSEHELLLARHDVHHQDLPFRATYADGNLILLRRTEECTA